jgi:hypothetical protein
VIGDVVEVFDLYFGVPVLFGIEHDVGTLLAGAETHVRLDLDVSKAFGLDSLLQLGHEDL